MQSPYLIDLEKRIREFPAVRVDLPRMWLCFPAEEKTTAFWEAHIAFMSEGLPVLPERMWDTEAMYTFVRTHGFGVLLTENEAVFQKTPFSLSGVC